MKCIHCNHNLPDDSEFCQYCGRKVDLVPDVIAEEPNLEGMSSDDAINAILKIHARNTIETMKANQNSQ